MYNNETLKYEKRRFILVNFPNENLSFLLIVRIDGIAPTSRHQIRTGVDRFSIVMRTISFGIY